MTTTGELVASVHIDAPPETVYPYFTDEDLMVRWLGTTATLDPTPGGVFAVDVGDAAARGTYLCLNPPRSVVFTGGCPAATPFRPEAPGSRSPSRRLTAARWSPWSIAACPPNTASPTSRGGAPSSATSLPQRRTAARRRSRPPGPFLPQTPPPPTSPQASPRTCAGRLGGHH